jgi:hypothetical protein
MDTKNPSLNFGLFRYASVAEGSAAMKSSSFFGILKRAGDQVDHFFGGLRPENPVLTGKQRQLFLHFP